ncbi:hypothetical protein BT69DRAFT_1336830 [Atractiella rhizophila]|nr:hypothetical protein BT69DRAFT_1339449 [Atractiella rhizophila]KAH8920021.1 hypothetical protein BT69DRAFT_1336830 [Atractiella rhizophila]
MADIANLDPSTQQYLLDLYKILKPGQNPFVVTATILKAELNPELPESFVIQLYILSGVFAFALLCAVITMILRFRRDASMSLFRLIPTSKGNFWCPQTSNSFSLLTGFFLIVAQGNIWVTVRVNRDHASQINFVLWKSIVWIPLFLTLVLETWGTLITTLMSSRRYKRDGSSFVPPIAPIYINIFWLFPTFLWPASIVTVFVLANEKFNTAFRQYENLLKVLAVAAPKYDGNLANVSQFEDIFPLIGPFLRNIEDFLKLFRIGYILWAAAAISMLIIYLPIAVLYVRTLRAQIKILKSRTKVGKSSFFSYGDPQALNGPGKPKLTKEDQRLHDSLTTAYNNLIVSCIAILLCSLSYAGIALWIAVDTRSVVRDSIPLQIEQLGSLYVYGGLGLAANILTMIRAFDQTTNHKISSRSGPSAEEATRPRSGTVHMSAIHSQIHDHYPTRSDARADFDYPGGGVYMPGPSVVPIKTSDGQMWDVVDYYSTEDELKSERSNSLRTSNKHQHHDYYQSN